MYMYMCTFWLSLWLELQVGQVLFSLLRCWRSHRSQNVQFLACKTRLRNLNSKQQESVSIHLLHYWTATCQIKCQATPTWHVHSITVILNYGKRGEFWHWGSQLVLGGLCLYQGWGKCFAYDPEDEIRYKKCVDNLSKHNQFCSAILHFWSAIKILFLPNSMRTHMNVYRKIATQRAKPGYEVSTWLYC